MASGITPGIDFYGADWCGDCRRSKRLLDSLGVAYAHHDVEHDDAARDRAVELSGRQSIPVIAFADGVILVEPSDPDLRAALESRGLLAP